MDIEDIFNNLESNKSQESEDARKKLVELFSQNKEQWLVQYMMEYIHKTGSLRIMEVLVKVQSPMDIYILDRLDDWLKMNSHRLDALNIFGFVVRMHPTWLFKVEKHRLFKTIFKLLTTEKEIVPLMSALLCIITLLPIIPNLVPNFFNELFDVFGHLASWNCQNPNRLSDDKLVHLQLGLQILFHRLYGMYPCNCLAFITEFIKKEKGAIFHHTIKPLLETVRVHPMLVTATPETELNNIRWKDMEPHDVVIECSKLSLQVLYQESVLDAHLSADLLDTPISSLSALGASSIRTAAASNPAYLCNLQSIQRQKEFCAKPNSRFDSENSLALRSKLADVAIWSPYNEIAPTGAIPPLTPTPTYMVPQPSTMMATSQLLSATGTSPPEAAVEATPETTPMKDARLMQRSGGLMPGAAHNPLAVRAIFAPSQPSSPMRKDMSQFSFVDVATEGNASNIEVIEQHVQSSSRVVSCSDHRVQQILKDQKETIASAVLDSNGTHEITTDVNSVPSTETNITDASMEHITRVCDDCNETESSRCTAGGLHIPTSLSMQVLAKNIKRRNRQRMTSYCYNEKTTQVNKTETSDIEALIGAAKIRRTKSCSSLFLPTSSTTSSTAGDITDDDSPSTGLDNCQLWVDRRLQKSAKMLAIAAAKKRVLTPKITTSTVATQTVGIEPNNYESSLFEVLSESKRQRNKYENNQLSPLEILNQFILHAIKSDYEAGSGHRGFDQHDQYKLLCLQLEYERYRREIHAERNRRLMGRNRDKRSLEMERDRLREQLKNFAAENKELSMQMERTKKVANESEKAYLNEIAVLKASFQHELDKNKCLQQENEAMKSRLTEELASKKNMNFTLEELKGQIFNITAELQQAELQVEMGQVCKQELARLEAEFIVMGEVQLKCRDRLNELDNCRLRDDECQMLQETCTTELKDLKHVLTEKSSQLDSAKHKIIDLQAQLQNSEKVITEQKRLLKSVKDEYEEKFKALNKKYDVQKLIILQMEEKIMMSLQMSQSSINACSPDIDKTDVASTDRNSPLSTSLASSESLSASLRSTELRNLQQLVEAPLDETNGAGISSFMGHVRRSTVSSPSNIIDGARILPLDLASSANTANEVRMPLSSTSAGININMDGSASASAEHEFETMLGTGHGHPHLYLQQHQYHHTQQQK